MTDEINIHLKKTSTWQRIFFMVVLAVIVSVVRTMLWAVIFWQVITTLLTGGSNPHILSFSRSLSAYLYHITLYLTFNTEVLPFPFSNWQITEQFDLAHNINESHD
jgi:Domain of unknown function (DUF4389)